MEKITDYTNVFLSDPTSIQRTILSEYEKRLDGDGVVVDANNTFMYALEAFSRISSAIVEQIDDKLRQVYSRRAVTTKDLYNHISDYDYVGFYSTPSILPIRMMLHKDYILEKAVPVPGTNYNKIVIPKDTVFTVGGYTFGIHYAIEIRVNPIVKSISIVYDTTTANPLNSLDNNTLMTEEMRVSGITLIAFEFPTYQFTQNRIYEQVNPSMGYCKRYRYDNRFYAVRVWDQDNNTEIALTMSDEIYDPLIPTAILRVYPETTEISLDIPQIYFTEHLIGSNIEVELYSTLGEVDINLSAIRLEDVKANFSLDRTKDMTYTTILRNIPTVIITPTVQRIQGGSNGFSFKQIKDRVVYNRGASVAPITNLDISIYFSERGFISFKKIDNLTDRRYYAYKALSLTDNISVANCTFTIIPEALQGNASISLPTTNRLTVLPDMVYRFDSVGNTLSPLSSDEVLNFSSLSNQQLADELNANQYLMNPYHIVLNTKNRYPSAVLYDLFDISAGNIGFVAENVNLSVQLNVVSAQIEHLSNGSGGYKIRLGINKSDEMSGIPVTDQALYLTFETTTGTKVGMKGTYAGEYSNLSVYDFQLSTEYNLIDDMIELTNLVNTGGGVVANRVLLDSKFFIVAMVKKSRFPQVPQSLDILRYLVDDDNTWLMVSLQTVDYHLGESLDDVLDTNLLVNWTPEKYAVHDVVEYQRYEHDVYETDVNGNITYTIDATTGEILTDKLHDIGDLVLDTLGDPVIKYEVGSTILDAAGNPTVIGARITEYQIELSGYDYRNAVGNSNFSTELSLALKSNYPTVREMDNNIMENTRVFFKPITSLGNALYKLNNTSTMQAQLGLSFVFTVFITQTTFENASLTATINSKIETIVTTMVREKVISLTKIATEVQTSLSDYILSIDVVSINGYSDVQTLVNIDVDKTPRLQQHLVVDDSGELVFESDITVNFQTLDV